MRRTKIVATIGPASERPEVLGALIDRGMNVARLNSSHADIPELAARLKAVRVASERAGRHVAVLLDLAGPKLRVGEISSDTVLVPGQEFRLVPGACMGDGEHACVTYAGLGDDVVTGDMIMLDDGRLELQVTGVDHGSVITRVEAGGPLSSHKGVNVPGTTLGVDAITARDREVLAWGLEAGVDAVAQSFVRGPEDVAALRRLMGDSVVPIVAKIEKHEAAGRIEEIVAEADVVMVARGDLGVETSPERVPVLQRRIIQISRGAGVPVIVATQMLESMTTSPRPTRAEASDVANAIFDMVDAVMLSAETAVGEYPERAVGTMARIAMTAEESIAHVTWDRASAGDTEDVTQAVSAGVCDLAQDLRLAAIVTATQSGATARAVARYRPPVPIVAATPDQSVARALQWVWGVHPLVVPLPDDTDEMIDAVSRQVMAAGLASPGQRVALTAGRGSHVPGSTDFILVRELTELT
ncbi:MAG: pyruvate kinase [Actinomycetota bacterium]|jgi:pyruvate kinase|nr:pyruvate kinase [Actinomycetota bacterium]